MWLDLFEVTVLLWTLVIDLTGVFAFVRFKKGGPYDAGGHYMSDLKAIVILIGTVLFAHYVFDPILRTTIMSFSAQDQLWLSISSGFAIVVIFWLINKSRKRG